MIMMAFGTLIIAIAAMAIFVVISGKFTKTDDYLLSYHAEDFQLLFESVQAVPGDVAVPYELSKGFQLELRADRFIIKETDSGVDRERWLHLLPGMKTEQGRGIGAFKIVKENNLISITGGSLFLEDKDSCIAPTKRSSMTVQTFTGTLATTGVTEEEAKKLHEATDYYLSKEERLRGGDVMDTFYLTISIQDDTRPTMTVKRPETDIVGEADYDYFLCALGNAFKDQFEIQESLTQETTRREAELIIGLPPGQQQAFIRERAEFGNNIALILKGYVEVKNDDTP